MTNLRNNHVLLIGLLILGIFVAIIIGSGATGFFFFFFLESSTINVESPNPNSFSSIASDIADSTKFDWNAGTKTATVGTPANNVNLNITDSGELIEKDSTLIVNGNLEIYGDVSFDNVTVKMNCTADGSCGLITYSGSNLIIDNSSNISAYGSKYYNFTVDGYIDIQNSEASRMCKMVGYASIYGLVINSNNNIIVNNTIYDSHTGIHLGYTTDYNNVSYNNITTSSQGINIYYSDDNEIHHNIIESSSGYGIGIRNYNSNDNKITFNIATGGRTGIVVDRLSSNNYLANNDLRYNFEYSIYIIDDRSCNNNNRIFS